MNLLRKFKKISSIILLLVSQNVSSGIASFIDDISLAVDKQLSDRGIKPYIIPMDQGRLISHEKFQEIDVGLSKILVSLCIVPDRKELAPLPSVFCEA